MSENTLTSQNDSRHELRELVSSQLKLLLEKNKCLQSYACRTGVTEAWEGKPELKERN